MAAEISTKILEVNVYRISSALVIELHSEQEMKGDIGDTMKRKNSVPAAVLAAAMAAGLAACGSTSSTNTTGTQAETAAAAESGTEATSASSADTGSTDSTTEAAAESATEGGSEGLPAGMAGMMGQESTEDLITPAYENVPYASVSDSEVCNIYLPENAAEGKPSPSSSSCTAAALPLRPRTRL